MGGRKPDGVGTYPASDAQVQSYDAATAALMRMPTPVLRRSHDPHSYLYFAMLDGSGQDLASDGEHPTNVGQMERQLRILANTPEEHIASGYVPGPGTQSNPFTRVADSALGFSWDERIGAAVPPVAPTRRRPS